MDIDEDDLFSFRPDYGSDTADSAALSSASTPSLTSVKPPSPTYDAATVFALRHQFAHPPPGFLDGLPPEDRAILWSPWHEKQGPSATAAAATTTTTTTTTGNAAPASLSARPSGTYSLGTRPKAEASPVVPMERSKSAWMPDSVRRRLAAGSKPCAPGAGAGDATPGGSTGAHASAVGASPRSLARKRAQVLGQAKGLLNKLTLDSAHRLSPQVVNLVHLHPDLLGDIVQVMFDKVCGEPAFALIYARLCATLVSSFDIESATVVRTELMQRCMQRFQHDDDPAVDRAVASGAIQLLSPEERDARIRLRALGNVTFVAQLYLCGVFAEEVVLQCASQLLHKADAQVEEQDVDHLVRLLTLCGKRLEASTKGRAAMQDYVKHILHLTSHCETLSQRSRFMLTDVIELRAKGWGASRRTNAHTLVEAGAPPAVRSSDRRKPEVVFDPSTGLFVEAPSQPPASPTAALQSSPVSRGLSLRQHASPPTTAVGGGGSPKGRSPKKSVSFAPLPGSLEAMTPEQRTKTRVKEALMELLCSHVVEETIQTLQELNIEAAFLPRVVYYAVSMSLDMSERSRHVVCQLFDHFTRLPNASCNTLVQGFALVLDDLEELVKDVPNVASIVASFMCYTVRECNVDHGAILASLRSRLGANMRLDALLQSILDVIKDDSGS